MESSMASAMLEHGVARACEPSLEQASAAQAPRGHGRRAEEFSGRELAAVGILVVADWMTVFGCLGFVWWARHRLAPVLPSLGPVTPLPFFLLHLYFLLPWTLAFCVSGLYTRRTLFWDEARRVVSACSLAALVAIAISFAGGDAARLSRMVIGGTWLMTLVAVPLARVQVKRWLAALGLWTRRMVILGAGESGRQVCARLRAHAELGYDPVAFVDDDPGRIGTCLDGIPVLGPLASAADIVQHTRAREVVVAMPQLSRERLLELVATCEGHVRSIRVVPDLFGLASVGVEAEDLDGVLLLHMRWNLAVPWNRLIKRCFDVVVGTAAVLLASPLLLLAALATRFDSSGPIFFAQARLGRDRRPFRCLKLRTMYADADARLAACLASDADSRAEWERFAKLKGRDPRVTRVGRTLRRFSLDELPQLLNVLRGEMSLVGPRPYLPSEIERMGARAETILKARPGLTGLWQVSGRSTLTFEHRLRLDEYYTRNWSLWTDIMVLCHTTGAVWRADGAY
ncbi:MAG: undecaprenyl-phosphate galactose phosphotransferase WbaP [Candidatus Binatia bacterium]